MDPSKFANKFEDKVAKLEVRVYHYNNVTYLDHLQLRSATENST